MNKDAHDHNPEYTDKSKHHAASDEQAQVPTMHLSTARLLQEVRGSFFDYQNLSLLLDTILKRTLALTHYNSGSILLLSGPLGPLEVYASIGDDPIAVGTRVLDLAASVSGYVIRSQRPLILADHGEGIGIAWRSYTRSIPAAVCLPLTGMNGSAIGVLSLKHTQISRFLAPDEFDALQLLVARYAAMIEYARLRDAHIQMAQAAQHSLPMVATPRQMSTDSQFAKKVRQIIHTLRARGCRITLDESPLPSSIPSATNKLLVRLIQQSLAIICARSTLAHAHLTLRFSNPVLSLVVQSWDESYSLSGTSDGSADIDAALSEIAQLRTHIAKLEGDAQFQVQPGIGALLTVTIPVALPAQDDTAAAHPAGPDMAPFGTTARLILAAPHAITRAGLRMMLSSEPYMTIVAEAGNDAEALESCRQHQPDLLLFSILETTDTASIEQLLSSIQRDSPATRVMLIAQPHTLKQFVQAHHRVISYLHAEASNRELLQAVQQVMQGEIFVDPGVAPYLQSGTGQVSATGASSQTEHLTRRELQVLQQLVKGKTNRQIADKLNIGRGTVKTHVEHIIAKLQVSDRTQAAVRATELGLLPDE